MAIKPADNESFYREVDEELRREQLSGAWKRYGRWIVAAVLLLLAAIAGFLYWQHSQQREAEQHAEVLTKAFDQAQGGQLKEASTTLQTLAGEGDAGYRAAALVTDAVLAVQAGREAEAAATFGKVAADADLPAPYRNLALVRQTALQFDSLPPATVIQRLEPLAKPGNPWFGSAGEMVALAHLKQNQPNRAGPIFAAMAKDEKLPESIRSRARQMAGSLGLDATEDAPAGAGADTGAGAAAEKEVTE